MDLNATLLGQAISFGILIWFTMKFVWPFLLGAMQEREKRIAEGLAAAERGRLDLEAAGKRSAEMLGEAKQKVQEVLAQADRRAAQIVEEAKQIAKAEGDRIITGAKAEIEQEFSRAKDALREQVAGLAVAGAEKILRREVDARAHADLLSQLKQELR
jgi:F-type H+-transporting ATPase subunit b